MQGTFTVKVGDLLRAVQVPGSQRMTTPATVACRHCGRQLVKEDGRWIDPEPTGDDSVWRETCDRSVTFTAEHEPVAS